MFAYCENNPVNKFDPRGDFAVVAIGALAGIALWKIGLAVIGGVATFVVVQTIIDNPSIVPTVSITKTDDYQKEEVETQDVVTTKSRRDPVHHIVAKADPRATESRQILRDVGIEPLSDPRNIVVLPQNYHASLHTTAYHKYVTEKLKPVAGDKAGVEATLAALRAEILARSSMGIRWE